MKDGEKKAEVDEEDGWQGREQQEELRREMRRGLIREEERRSGDEGGKDQRRAERPVNDEGG